MAKLLILVSALICLILLPNVLATRYVPKWKKQACEVPSSQNEHSHYVCDDNGEVQCLHGWTGDLCDVPRCRKGCDPLQGYCKRPFECRCKLGYYGDRCNKCIALPGCQHGYCNTSFECICHEGWDGLFCSEPTCRLDCHATRGYCEMPGECRCRLGWSGTTCKDCQVLPGCQHGYCTKPLECRCHPGYTGLLCQSPSHVNPAICAESCHKERGYCRKPGECRCRVGWYGKNCDKCYPYPGCVNGSCRRPWECNCKPGWGGMLCDEELTYCENNSNLCENAAKCVSLTIEDGNYRCLCREGFTGRNCEISEMHSMTTSKPNVTITSTSTTQKPSSTTPASTTEEVPMIVTPDKPEQTIDNEAV